MEPPKKYMLYTGDPLLEAGRPSSSASSTSYHDSNMQSLGFHTAIHNLDVDNRYTPQCAVHEFVVSPSETASQSTADSKTRNSFRVLGAASLTSIVYFSSCGGPVGSEPLMSAGGPLLGLLGINFYFIFCQMPLMAMITELCCAFPENGGHSVWAMIAFGPFWGFQSGYWAYIRSLFNNAIYPGLIFKAVTEAYGVEITSSIVAFLIKAAIAIVLALPSYFSVRSVGVGSLFLLVIVMIIVLMLAVWAFIEGLGEWDCIVEVRTAKDVTDDHPQGGIDWKLLLHTLFWSFDGMSSVSVIGGEVFNPAGTFPRVMASAATLTIVTYLLALVPTVVADRTEWLDFAEEGLTNIADAIGGSVLRKFVVVASVVSAIGLYTCSFFYQTFLVQGMAQSQLLPAMLRKRHARFKTPKYAFYFSLAATLCLVGFHFETILTMSNACSGLFQILMVLSMLELRRSFPSLPRPFRMPGSSLVLLAVMLVPIVAVYVFLIVTTLTEWKLAAALVAFVVPGILFPFIRQKLNGRQLCG